MAQAKSTARSFELEEDERIAAVQAIYMAQAAVAREPGDESHALFRALRKLDVRAE